MRTEPFTPDELTCDEFLGGAVRLRQPRAGYRSGVDPVLLAAATDAVPGQSVLELGCGSGAALICLGIRVPGLDLTGVELQPAYAALARENLALNGLTGTVYTAHLADLPKDLRQRSFDHVIANPPYFRGEARTPATASDRELALSGDTPLEDWVATAARRLAPRGHALFIQHAERTPELLTAMQRHLGSLALWPIAPRPGRAANLVLVRGRKGGHAAFRCHSPFIMHGPRGESPPDRYDDYTAEAAEFQSGPKALRFPH